MRLFEHLSRVHNNILLLIFLLSLPLTMSIEWLALSYDTILSWNTSSDCSRAKPLSKQQRVVCERHLDMMTSVEEAAREVMDVCQELFADKRWNCSSILLAPNYAPDLTGGSREQAYLYALTSAAVSRAVAKACSAGLSSRCSCSSSSPQDTAIDTAGYYRWGGCGDDVRYGTIFGKAFLDAAFQEKKRSKRSLMNLQNNAVGRKILGESLTPTCKCHGVSGSCTVKTCYKVLPALKTIGTTLQKRYHAAVEVKRPKRRKNSNGNDFDDDDETVSDSKRKRRDKARDLVAVMTSDPITDDDLVYYTISPDYCLPDLILGSIGTKNRECDKEGAGSGGCRSMCCGRGFKTETVEQQYRCDCRYYWCCYVKCKTCTRVVQIHRCR